jgi:hypothetical protein
MHSELWHRYDNNDLYWNPEHPQPSELLEVNRRKIKVFTAEEPWFTGTDFYVSVAEKLYFINIKKRQIITNIPPSVHTIILNDANIIFQPQTENQFDHITQIVISNSSLRIFTVFHKLKHVIITSTNIHKPFKCKTFSIVLMHVLLSEIDLTELEAISIKMVMCGYSNKIFPIIMPPVENLEINAEGMDDESTSLNKLPETLIQIAVERIDEKSKIMLRNMALKAAKIGKPFRVVTDYYAEKSYLKDLVAHNKQSAAIDQLDISKDARTAIKQNLYGDYMGQQSFVDAVAASARKKSMKKQSSVAAVHGRGRGRGRGRRTRKKTKR